MKKSCQRVPLVTNFVRQRPLAPVALRLSQCGWGSLIDVEHRALTWRRPGIEVALLGCMAIVSVRSRLPVRCALLCCLLTPCVVAEEKAPVAAEQNDQAKPDAEPEPTLWLGAFYRHVVVPSAFMNGVVMDSSTTLSNPAFGVSIERRNDNFVVSGNLWWAWYHVYGPFLEKDHKPTDVEIWDADTSIAYLSATIRRAIPLTNALSFEFGAELGAGYLLGDIVRTEAYPGEGPGSADGFAPCEGPYQNDPAYCGNENEHFGVRAKRVSEGGRIPDVAPWLAVPIALRFSPTESFQARLDGGLALGHWFIGLQLATRL